MSELRSTPIAGKDDDLWDRLAHISRELLVIADPDGTITYIDPAFAHTLGRGPEELLADGAFDFVHPDDREVAGRLWGEVLDTPGAEAASEYRLVGADGAEHWMEVTTANMVDDAVIRGVATYFRDVTDRHEVEESLRASEERYRALVQYSYDAIVVTDAWMVARWVSPAFEGMFGYEPHELIGISGLDHVHPDDLPHVMSSAEELFSGSGRRTITEFRMRHKAGHWVWIECRSVNLLSHPAVRGVVNNFRDVTSQHEALAGLAQSEQRLRALLQNADSAVVVSDEWGRLTWVSAPIERLFGDAPETLIGTRLVRRIHPDDRAEVVRHFAKVLEAPDLMTRVESRVRHADGNYRWYEAVWTNCIDDPAVAGVVANLRDVTERVLAEQALRDSEARLEHQATHDHLTGLPNRRWLFERIEEARDRASWSRAQLTLLFLDLDHFKWVNDSRGHDVGDELLVSVARRLEHVLRDGDVVARFGGDEFVIFCEGLHDDRHAMAEASRIQAAVTGPYRIRGSEIYVTVTTGVATASPDGSLVEDLIRDADSAMYEAKERGRERIEIFDSGMRARAIRRLELEGWLRQAVDKDELRLHFQPLVDLQTGRVCGAEALVRWQHPRQGLLLPGAFIEVAEQTGLVLAIDQWVFERATQVAAAWPTRYGGSEGVTACVNLSARQFGEPALTTKIEDALRSSRLPPERLHVEITEGVVMEDVDTSISVLSALRDLGVKVAIDDFGTGYSSLSYLRRLPVDVLKIDRAFVRGLGRDDQDSAIVETVVGLSHRLGLEVVAEGVEDLTQLELLRRMGCDVAQGFFLSRPVPPADFHQMLIDDPVW